MKPSKNYEKTEYGVVLIKNTLLGMKDISELRMDLAYSAALFNTKN